MGQLRPGEVAPEDGFYLTGGHSIFLRRGQAMPVINLDLGMEAELNRYLSEDIEGELRGTSISRLFARWKK